jgi:hypothetical protein
VHRPSGPLQEGGDGIPQRRLTTVPQVEGTGGVGGHELHHEGLSGPLRLIVRSPCPTAGYDPPYPSQRPWRAGNSGTRVPPPPPRPGRGPPHPSPVIFRQSPRRWPGGTTKGGGQGHGHVGGPIPMGRVPGTLQVNLGFGNPHLPEDPSRRARIRSWDMGPRQSEEEGEAPPWMTDRRKHRRRTRLRGRTGGSGPGSLAGGGRPPPLTRRTGLPGIGPRPPALGGGSAGEAAVTGAARIPLGPLPIAVGPIVGDVEARSLEEESRPCGEKALGLGPALRAGIQGFVRHPLELFELVPFLRTGTRRSAWNRFSLLACDPRVVGNLRRPPPVQPIKVISRWGCTYPTRPGAYRRSPPGWPWPSPPPGSGA